MDIANAIAYFHNNRCSIIDLETVVPQFAISLLDDNACIVGAILMGKVESLKELERHNQIDLIHMHTNGSPLVGSILYGAAWRASKALGFEKIRI